MYVHHPNYRTHNLTMSGLSFIHFLLQTNFKRNKYNINVSGENVPPPLEHFDEMSKVFGISNQLIQNVKNGGYESPTPIQMQAIPIMLKVRIIIFTFKLSLYLNECSNG